MMDYAKALEEFKSEAWGEDFNYLAEIRSALEIAMKLETALIDARWKGEPCHNPEKGWITDSKGNRITRLGNRNALGKLIEIHNQRIDYVLALTQAATKGTRG